MRQVPPQENHFHFPTGNIVLTWTKGSLEQPKHEIFVHFHPFDSSPELLLFYSFEPDASSHDVWLAWAYHLRYRLLHAQGDEKKLAYFVFKYSQFDCIYTDPYDESSHLLDLEIIKEICDIIE